jgi:hypothetical protein
MPAQSPFFGGIAEIRFQGRRAVFWTSGAAFAAIGLHGEKVTPPDYLLALQFQLFFV